jgi:hypothetical protein
MGAINKTIPELIRNADIEVKLERDVCASDKYKPPHAKCIEYRWLDLTIYTQVYLYMKRRVARDILIIYVIYSNDPLIPSRIMFISSDRNCEKRIIIDLDKINVILGPPPIDLNLTSYMPRRCKSQIEIEYKVRNPTALISLFKSILAAAEQAFHEISQHEILTDLLKNFVNRA